MTPAEIKAQREKLDDRLSEAHGEVERVRLEIRILQTRCKHPSQYRVCHMGEDSMYCPDCGRDQ